MVPPGRRRPAATVHAFARLVEEDASSRKGSYSYSYNLTCEARQHDSSCIISIPPYCGSSSSGGGGGAERADAVACVGRAQQQQQQQQSSTTQKWKLVLVLVLFIFDAQSGAAPS